MTDELTPEKQSTRFYPLPEPENKEGIGHVLWNILGGEKASRKQAALKLGITVSYLSRIIHGQIPLTWKAINQKKLVEKLAEHYQEGWAENRAAFEQYLNKIPRAIAIHPKEPKDKDSFGHLIWEIIGGKEAYVSETARHLKINPEVLAGIIQRGGVSQQAITEQNWREVFKEQYPAAWEMHAVAFEQHVQLLRANRSGSDTHQPQNEDSFGFILWNILGGKKTRLLLAAKHLKIPHDQLTKIVHDKRSATQALLREKKWRKVLAEHYSTGWIQQQADFERYAAILPADNLNHCKEPENKDSPGHVLWQALGGPHARIREAAKFMGINERRLSKIIQGTLPFPIQEMNEKNWNAIIAEHYPKNWYERRSAPKRKVKRSKPKRKVSKKPKRRKTVKPCKETKPQKNIDATLKRVAKEKTPQAEKPRAAATTRKKREKPRAKPKVTVDPVEQALRQDEVVRRQSAHETWCLAAGTFFRELRLTKGGIVEDFVLAARLTLPENEKDDIHLPSRLARDALAEICVEDGASAGRREGSYAIRARHLLKTFA